MAKKQKKGRAVPVKKTKSKAKERVDQLPPPGKSFFDLPLELRLIIYGYALYAPGQLIRPTCIQTAPSLPRHLTIWSHFTPKWPIPDRRNSEEWSAPNLGYSTSRGMRTLTQIGPNRFTSDSLEAFLAPLLWVCKRITAEAAPVLVSVNEIQINILDSASTITSSRMKFILQHARDLTIHLEVTSELDDLVPTSAEWYKLVAGANNIRNLRVLIRDTELIIAHMWGKDKEEVEASFRKLMAWKASKEASLKLRGSSKADPNPEVPRWQEGIRKFIKEEIQPRMTRT